MGRQIYFDGPPNKALDSDRRTIQHPAMNIGTLISDAGGIRQLADRLGVNRTTVYDWIRNGCIPTDRVAQVAGEFGIALDVAWCLSRAALPATPS